MSYNHGPSPGSGDHHLIPATWTSGIVNTVSTGTASVGGGGNGFYHSGSGSFGPTHPYLTINPFVDPNVLTLKAGARLSASQLSTLLALHRFVPMDGNDFCLFCYALDLYRHESEHWFLISEE